LVNETGGLYGDLLRPVRIAGLVTAGRRTDEPRATRRPYAVEEGWVLDEQERRYLISEPKNSARNGAEDCFMARATVASFEPDRTG
jgi:hypothetical protein